MRVSVQFSPLPRPSFPSPIPHFVRFSTAVDFSKTSVNIHRRSLCPSSLPCLPSLSPSLPYLELLVDAAFRVQEIMRVCLHHHHPRQHKHIDNEENEENRKGLGARHDSWPVYLCPNYTGERGTCFPQQRSIRPRALLMT